MICRAMFRNIFSYFCDLEVSLFSLGLFESSSNSRDRTVSSGKMRDIAVTLPFKMKKVFID